MKALAFCLLMPAIATAATVRVYVFGSRDAVSIRRSFNDNGNLTGTATAYTYQVTAQIPHRPNGTWLGWEKSTNLTIRPTWAQVSNAVARVVAREMLAAGISTNGHTIAVTKGKRVTQ